MSPEEIASKLITIRKKSPVPEDDTWCVVYRVGYSSEPPRSEVDGYFGPKELIRYFLITQRAALAANIADVIEDCVSAVAEAQVDGYTEEIRERITTAIHERFAATADEEAVNLFIDRLEADEFRDDA